MSDSKRQCSKCQFFQTAQLSGNGWCTHPKRQVASDIKILVREKELACRNSWGDDLWVDAAASAASNTVDRTPRKGFSYVNLRVDDEVTSVVDTTARHGAENREELRPPAAADDVVTVTSIRHTEAAGPRPVDGDHNAPAIADQAERARHMARGSKDAIQKARERHVQRGKPTRPSIAPEPTEGRSDQVLDAQDRDHYARGAAERDRPQEDFRNVPPVPRAEVDTNGAGPLRRNGDDARFNRPARLDSNVDLSHLRGFLTPSVERSGLGSSRDTGPVTSYDLVLKRALEIRTAGGSVETAVSSPAVNQGAPSMLPSQPEPTHDDHHPPAASSRNGVVWDVGLGGDRLTIAFERARAAIDQPVNDRPESLAANPGSASGTHTLRRDQDFNDAPDANAYAEQWNDDDDPPAEDWATDQTWIDHLAGDDDEQESGALARNPRPVAESPRGSWWRSLNFGFKRRYQAGPEPDRPAFDDYGEWPDDLVEAARDDVAEFNDPAAQAFDPAIPACEREDLEATDGYDDANGSSDVIFVTSEESWRQDERAFPTPQPVEWHETRARLLRQADIPVVTGRHSRDDSRSGHRQDDYRDASSGQRNDAPMTERHAYPSYTFAEPSGMDAFREALFGDTGATRVVDEGGPHVPDDDPAPTRTRPRPDAARAARRDDAGRWADRSGETAEPGARGRTVRAHLAPSMSRGFDPDFTIPDASDDPDDDIDQRSDVASRISKSCSTCRSFQCADNGERGWCTNDYAKTHRQMVNADDLACRSSIGDWWIATDTAWIPPTSTILPDTPRTDRLAERAESVGRSEPQRRRRVRTSKVG